MTNEQPIQETEVIQTPTQTEAITEVLVDPIYKHKDGRIFTKNQLMTKMGLTEDRIKDGISKGMITQVGDTDDPTQQFKHKDGRIFSMKEFAAQGVTKDRVASGIEKGMIVPIEKKNQVATTKPPLETQKPEPPVSTTGAAAGASVSTTPPAEEKPVETPVATTPPPTPAVAPPPVEESKVDFSVAPAEKPAGIAQLQGPIEPVQSNIAVKNTDGQDQFAIITNPQAPLPSKEEAENYFNAPSKISDVNVFDNAAEYNKLKNAKTTKIVSSAGGGYETETPDEAAVKKANQIQQEGLDKKIDYDKVVKIGKQIDEYYTDPEENKKQKQDLSNLLLSGNKNQFDYYASQIAFNNELKKGLLGHFNTDETQRIIGNIVIPYQKLFETTTRTGPNGEQVIVAAQGDKIPGIQQVYNNLKNTLEIQNIENKEEILDNFRVIAARDIAFQAINHPEYVEADSLASTGLDENQIIGMRYVSSVVPEEIGKYRAALIPDEDIKDNWQAQTAKQQALKSLSQIGINIVSPLLNETLQDEIKNYNFNVNGLNKNYFYDQNPEDLKSFVTALNDQANSIDKLSKLSERLNTDYNNLNDDSKYGYANYYERQGLLQELTGQKHGFITQPLLKLGGAIYNTIATGIDIAKRPFLSDRDNEVNMATIMGKNIVLENELKVTQKNQMEKMPYAMTPEFEAAYNGIMNNKNLSDQDKENKVYDLIVDNPDGIQINPKGKESNLTLGSLWYGMTNLAADLAPYLAIEALTGGTATGGVAPSMLRKFSSSFIAAFTTGFHQSYLDAISRGSQNPYADAMRSATISSLAMATAGTPDIMRKIIGTKSVVGKMINKMTDKEILQVLRTEPKALSMFKKAYNFSGKVAEATWEGFKGGSKMVALTTAAQAINDEMYGDVRSLKEYVDGGKLEVLKFTLFGGITGGLTRGFTEKYGDLTKSVMFEAGANPKEFLEVLDLKIKNNEISKIDADQIRNNIELASKLYKSTYFGDSKGKPLDDASSRELLFLKMQEADIEKIITDRIPEELEKKLTNRLLNIKEKINDLRDGIEAPERKYRSIDVLTQGDIIAGDIIKNKEGIAGEVLQVNDNKTVVIKDIQTGEKFLWKPEDIAVKAPEPVAKTIPTFGPPTPRPTTPAPTTKQEEIVAPEPDSNIMVGDLIDKAGSYNGKKGVFYLDGQTVVFKEEGTSKEYDLGYINDIKDTPINQYGIQHEESVVSANEDGTFTIRGNTLRNGYSDPMQAINRDAEGNIMSVTLDMPNGTKRTFRGNVAEDLAYQIHLKEITKDNATAAEFEQFINEPEQQQQVNITAVPEATAEGTVAVNETVQRETLQPTVPATTEPIITGVEETELIRQAEPDARRMVDIEREFENRGYTIDTIEDNGIQIMDKDGEQVEGPEDLPKELRGLAAEYEALTAKLGDVSDVAREKALIEARKVTEVEAEVVEPETKQIERVTETRQIEVPKVNEVHVTRNTVNPIGVQGGNISSLHEDSRYIGTDLRQEYPELLKYNDGNLDTASAADLWKLAQLDHPNEYGFSVSRGAMQHEFETRGEQIFKELGFPTNPDALYKATYKGKIEKLSDILDHDNWWWSVADHADPVYDYNKELASKEAEIKQKETELSSITKKKDKDKANRLKWDIEDLQKEVELLKEGIAKGISRPMGDMPTSKQVELPKYTKTADKSKNPKSPNEVKWLPQFENRYGTTEVETRSFDNIQVTIEGSEDSGYKISANVLNEHGRVVIRHRYVSKKKYKTIEEAKSDTVRYVNEIIEKSEREDRQDIEMEQLQDRLPKGYTFERDYDYDKDEYEYELSKDGEIIFTVETPKEAENKINNKEYDAKQFGEIKLGEAKEIKEKTTETQRVFTAAELKENPDVLKENPEWYTVGYPNSFVGMSTNLAGLQGEGFNDPKVGDVVTFSGKEYVVRDIETGKKDPYKTSVSLLRVDKEGNILRQKDLSQKEQKEIASTEEEPTEIEAGDEIEFKTAQQNTTKGIKVEIPGLEGLDTILVQDGMTYEVYELTTGMKLADTENAMSPAEAVKTIANNIPSGMAEKILNKIYQSEEVNRYKIAGEKPGIAIMNESPAYKAFREQKIAEEENRPFLLDEKTRNEFLNLAEQAKSEGLDIAEKSLITLANTRQGAIAETPYTIERAKELLENYRKKKDLEERRLQNIPYPEKDIEKREITEDALIRAMQQGYKRDRWNKLPEEIKKAALEAWRKEAAIYNKYGYYPSTFTGGETFFGTTLTLGRYIGATLSKDASKREGKIKEDLRIMQENFKRIDEIYKQEGFDVLKAPEGQTAKPLTITEPEIPVEAQNAFNRIKNRQKKAAAPIETEEAIKVNDEEKILTLKEKNKITTTINELEFADDNGNTRHSELVNTIKLLKNQNEINKLQKRENFTTTELITHLYSDLIAIPKENRTKEHNNFIKKVNEIVSSEQAKTEVVNFAPFDAAGDLAENIKKLSSTELPQQKTIEQLRADEQAEYDAMPDPNDKVERKRIYDKYDELITPLLKETPITETTSPAVEQSQADYFKDLIKEEKQQNKELRKKFNEPDTLEVGDVVVDNANGRGGYENRVIRNVIKNENGSYRIVWQKTDNYKKGDAGIYETVMTKMTIGSERTGFNTLWSMSDAKAHNESLPEIPKEKRIGYIKEPYLAKIKAESKQAVLSSDVRTTPAKSLSLDEQRFQNRNDVTGKTLLVSDMISNREKNPESFDRVETIANNWKSAEQDPIHVWTDPKDGKTYVLSGHHRYAAALKAGIKDVKTIDRTKDFTEAQAIKFAREEANTNRAMETPLERAKALRIKRERGDSKEEINKFLSAEGKNASYINNLSSLSPNGKTMKMVEQFGSSPDKQTQKESEQRADWIGEARRTIAGLTDAHENEMFDFLFDKNKSKRVTTKADFLQKVRASVKPLTPEEPLNISRFEYKTQGESVYEEEVNSIKDQLAERQNKINEINGRFNNPNAKDYISTESANYAEARKVADAKIAGIEAERKALQKQLETVYSNKSKYTGGPSSGTLFSYRETRPEDFEDYVEGVTDMINESPEKTLQQVQAEVANYFDDHTPAFKKLIEQAYNEAKNNVTGRIVKTEVLQKLNKGFLKIGSTIFDNEQQLIAKARQLSGSRFSALDQTGRTPLEFSKDLEKQYGVKVDFLGSLEGGDLTLSRIEVPKELRDSGIGTKVMEDIINYADNNGKRIVLTPSKDFGATSVGRLKDFYSRFGFVENKGKSKDFSTKEAMYRNPQTPKQTFAEKSQTAGFETRDGKPIGFNYDTDQVARERFDFSKLKKIGEGSDRIVFDLGNGKVLKVAKTARGLEQNIYEGDGYLGFIPDVYERGLNYVVTDNIPRIKGTDLVPIHDIETGQEIGTVPAAEMFKDLKKFHQGDFDRHNSELQTILEKYGFGDVNGYELLYGDFNAARNWGYKDGKPYLIDAGTLGGVEMLKKYRGVKNLSDPDFRKIYYESRQLKKQYVDADKYTKFHYDENGEILGFTHGGHIYLNGQKITAKTTMEEAGHIWINHARETNSSLYNAGLKKVLNSQYLKDVNASEFYRKEALKQGKEGSKAYNDYMQEEALAKAISDEGAKFVTDAQRISFKDWVSKMWDNVMKAFGIRDLTPDQVAKLSLKDFAKMAAADVFAEGKPEAKAEPVVPEVKPAPKGQENVTVTTTVQNPEGERVTRTETIPTKNTYLYEGTEERQRGLYTHLMEADSVSQETKNALKKNGITYQAANNAQAELMAEDILKTYNTRDALQIARGSDVHASVRSAIFAKLIDAAYVREMRAKTPEEKMRAAQQWKDLVTEYANQLTAGGQFTAYAAHFYRTSPMGFIMKENADREARFNEWSKGKEKTLEELWSEINATAEGRSLVNLEVKKAREAEREAERKVRDKKIDDFFDKLKINPKNTYGFIIPLGVLNPVIDTMKLAVKAGDRVADVVQRAIEQISDKVGNSWDKEAFRKDYEEMLTGVVGKVTKESDEATQLRKRLEGLEKQIADLKEKIGKGGEAGKKKEIKFSGNPEVQKLIEERDQLKKENEDLLKNAKAGKYSDEAKIKAAKEAVLKSIEETKRKIIDNDLSIKKKEGPTDAELTAHREEQKRLRKELEDMRKEAQEGKYDPVEMAKAEAKRKQARIDELNRRINENDFSAEKEKMQKQKTALDDELAETKRRYDEAKKQSPEYKEKKSKQFLDRLRKRLEGLSERQRNEIVQRSLKQITEAGGLNYEEFRKIVAESMGYKDLTPAEVAEVEALTKTINSVDDAEDALVANPTEANLKALDKARQDAMTAGLKLYNKTHRQADIPRTFGSLITGSLLGTVTLGKNIIQNVVMQATMRVPKALIIQPSESALVWLGNRFSNSKAFNPSANIFTAQKGYFKGAGRGIKRGWFNFYKGTQERDYFGKISYQSTLAPRVAVKDLKLHFSGQKPLTKTELTERMIRATLGWQPDFILRAMGFGDRPFRWAAEGAAAIQIAKLELKLADENEINAFMYAPKKFAYKTLVDQGIPKDEALLRAAEIEDRIINAGSKAVLEEENVLSRISKYLDQGLSTKKDDSKLKQIAFGAASILKTATFPFVKIPANVYWQMFKVANPEVALLQGLYHGGKAFIDAKGGDKAEAKKQYEYLKDNLATAVLGYGVMIAVSSLVANGYVRPENDDETKAREREGEKPYEKGNQLNWGRMMGGEDYWIDLSWFGPIGTTMGVQAKIQEQNRRKQLKGETVDTSWAGDFEDRFTVAEMESLNQLVYDQAGRTIGAIKGGENGLKVWAINSMNTGMNIITGATYTQMSKAMLPVVPRLKAEGVMEEFKNNQQQRNVLYRRYSGMPPTRVSIWGDPIKQDTSFWGVVSNMLGFQETDAHQFGAILYYDAQRTGDTRFFPTAVTDKVTVDGVEIKLTQDQKDELATYIGQARKMLVGSFVYDCALPYEVPVKGQPAKKLKYNDKDMTDADKIHALEKIYNYGKEIGFAQFQKAHKEFAPAELTPSQLGAQIKREVYDEKFKMGLEKVVRAKGKEIPSPTKEEELQKEIDEQNEQIRKMRDEQENPE